ncbi:MAG: hypothetical protein AB3N24_21575 [Leisingera sp.]
MSAESPVLSVIVRKFRESERDAANEVLARFEQALRGQPGFLEVRHNAPTKESGGAFATVISFATLSDLIDWEQSETRRRLVNELSEFIEGEVVKNQLWDLDNLLGGLGKSHPPKKWKTVLVLTFWVLVVGACLNWIAGQVSPDFPSGYPRTVMLLVINILLNSYFFLPRSMALLHRFEERQKNRKTS